MIALIVQARIGSTRLPGKVLRPLSGKPMLQWELERLRHAKKIDRFVVATTGKSNDDPVASLAQTAGFEVFRGNETDVLDRYYQAAKDAKADVVVRVTGDCPLHEGAIVDLVVERFLEKRVDYTKQPENYPEGLDTEVFSFAALERAQREARLPSEREHVTPFIGNHPDLFAVDQPWMEGAGDYRNYHWSVDTEADFRFVQAIYAVLGANGTMFGMQDVLDILKKQPHLLKINRGGTGYEGLEKSRREDEAWQNNHGEI